MNITKATLCVEINNKPYVVALSKIDINLMMELVTRMFDNNTLEVLPLSEEYRFESIAESLKK